jgi:hypothetical protein
MDVILDSLRLVVSGLENFGAASSDVGAGERVNLFETSGRNYKELAYIVMLSESYNL